MQHVAGAAFRAILQNIQALELSFATKAVECFRNAGEGQLNYDKTMQALGTLDLTDFLGEMREGQGTAAGEVNPGVLLGSGSEYRRLWTLWSENRCADEQCFLFIAWRAHRFSEPSFVKEIAMPLFQILDHNGDQLITAEELEEAIMSEDPQKQLTEEARADAKKLRSELKELLLYHCDAAAPNESKGVDFPAFLAFICDAQDKCAMRRYTSKGPVECMARYHKGVVFLRPVNVAECAQPQEQEELEELMSSPAVEALREARASQARAEAALKEARTAKEAAEEAKKAVAQLATQDERRLERSAPSSSAQVAAAAAPAKASAPVVQSTVSGQSTKPVTTPRQERPPLQIGTIEEAPIVDSPFKDIFSMSPSAPSERPGASRRVVTIKRSEDVPCRMCQELIPYDSKFCKFCGAQQTVERRESALKLKGKASDGTALQSAEPQETVPKFRRAMDADPDSENLVETVPRPISSRLLQEEQVEESLPLPREAFCMMCGFEFQSEDANYCSNCGHHRDGGKRRSQDSSPPVLWWNTAEESKSATPNSSQEQCSPSSNQPPLGRPVSSLQQGKTVTVKRAQLAQAANSPMSDATTATTMRAPFEDGSPAAPVAPPEEDKDVAGSRALPFRPSEASLDTAEAVELHNKERRELESVATQTNRSPSRNASDPMQGETVRLAPVAAPVPAPIVCSPPVSTTPGSTLTNPSPQVVAKPFSDADDYEWCEEEESEEEEEFEDDPVVDPGTSPNPSRQAQPKARS